MFDELNQTSITFPPEVTEKNKKKQQIKLMQGAKKTSYTTNEFPEGLSTIKSSKPSEVVTGIGFYKDYI